MPSNKRTASTPITLEAGITVFTLSAPTTSSQIPPRHFPVTGRDLVEHIRQYTAETIVEVVFENLDQLATLAVELSAMENVIIQQTKWRLTDATRDRNPPEARISASRNVVAEANDYAGVVGREVLAFHITNGHVSMDSTRRRLPAPHSHGSLFGAPKTQLMGSKGAAGGTIKDGPSLKPAIITIWTSVNVKSISKDGDMVPANRTMERTLGWEVL